MIEYLIAHIGHTIKEHEHVCWWKPDSKGYTICIDKAGLYDEAEARANCSNGSCIAVEKHIAERFATSTPYYRRQDGRLAKLYDGGPHRPVPNSREAWQYLMSGRLHGCAHPYEPPTPISAKKSRAIYLDGVAP